MKKKITNIGAILVVLAILAFNLKTTFNNDSQRYNLSLSFLTASADGSNGSGSGSGNPSGYPSQSGDPYLTKVTTMCSDGTTYATGCTGTALPERCDLWSDVQPCQGTIGDTLNLSNQTVGNTVKYNITCVNYGHLFYNAGVFKRCSRCGMTVPLGGNIH